MSEHRLKTWPPYWRHVYRGLKTFEFRKNDRGFKEGDILYLEEWSPETQNYTGNVLRAEVTYMITGGQFGIPEGYCIMGIEI